MLAVVMLKFVKRELLYSIQVEAHWFCHKMALHHHTSCIHVCMYVCLCVRVCVHVHVHVYA